MPSHVSKVDERLGFKHPLRMFNHYFHIVRISSFFTSLHYLRRFSHIENFHCITHCRDNDEGAVVNSLNLNQDSSSISTESALAALHC